MTKILSATPVVSSFPKKTEKTIDKFYMKAYYKYFKIKLGNQDKTWVPQIIYKSCRTAGKQTALKFGIPMIWPEPANHFGDCYFCMTNLVGYNKKNERTFFIHQFLQLHDQFLILTKTQCLFLKSYLIFLFQLHLFCTRACTRRVE